MKKDKPKALDTDALIDRFVESVNRLPREPGFEDDIPPSVRGEPDDPEALYIHYDWHIRPWPDIDWIEPLERQFGVVLPPSYRSLVTRYVFPRFEAGPLLFNSNTPEGLLMEFRHQDPTFMEVLVPLGYIPFANPITWDYDPICFDTRRPTGGGECRLIRIEHESVLCDGKIGDTEDVAPNFIDIVKDFIATASPNSSL